MSTGTVRAMTSIRDAKLALATTNSVFGHMWFDSLRQLRQKLRHARKEVVEQDKVAQFDRYEARLLAMENFAKQRESGRSVTLADARQALSTLRSMREPGSPRVPKLRKRKR